MMQAAQNGRHDDSMLARQLVPFDADHAVRGRIRKRRSQAAMWPAAIVMADPLPKNGARMVLGHRNHEVQIFTTNRPDHPLAGGVSSLGPGLPVDMPSPEETVAHLEREVGDQRPVVVK